MLVLGNRNIQDTEAMSGITFGSVGDIISVCLIVQSIAKALSDSRGSASEFRVLMGELESSTAALKQVQHLVTAHPKVTDAESLYKAVESCRECLEAIASKISKFKASLQADSSQNIAVRTFWKLRWQNQNTQVIEWRHQVSVQYAELHLQLSTFEMSVFLSFWYKIDD